MCPERSPGCTAPPGPGISAGACLCWELFSATTPQLPLQSGQSGNVQLKWVCRLCPQLSPSTCWGEPGIEATLPAPLMKCQRPPGPLPIPPDGCYSCPCPRPTLGRTAPLATEIPGQAEATRLENKPCAEALRMGQRVRFNPKTMSRDQTS